MSTDYRKPPLVTRLRTMLDQLRHDCEYSVKEGSEYFSFRVKPTLDVITQWIGTLIEATDARHLADSAHRFEQERDEALVRVDALTVILTQIWTCIPPSLKTRDGRTFEFKDPDPARTLRVLTDAIKLAQGSQELSAVAHARRDALEIGVGYLMVLPNASMQRVPPSESAIPSANCGHGHVFKRPDGLTARCGGVGMCPDCTHDKIRHTVQLDRLIPVPAGTYEERLKP